MEQIFSTIERIRRLPEPIRRQVLWAIVAGFIVIFGALWALTLGWQFSQSGSVAAEKEEIVMPLKSPTESLKQSVDGVGSSVREALRMMILEDEASQPIFQEDAEGASPGEQISEEVEAQSPNP